MPSASKEDWCWVTYIEREMERGTDRELEMVQKRWAEFDRESQLAIRLEFGLALLFAGLILLLVASASGERICLAAHGLPGVTCDGVVPELLQMPLVGLGGILIVTGLWGCWTVFRE